MKGQSQSQSKEIIQTNIFILNNNELSKALGGKIVPFNDASILTLMLISLLMR